MPDEAILNDFYQMLESEITEGARDGGTGTGEFREIVLTELFAEELSILGVLESPVVCHLETGRAAASLKVNGYGVPEEDSRLDLFVSAYFGPGTEAASINATDIGTAFSKLERFLGRALDGLKDELDPASDQFLMADRIHRVRKDIDRVCLHVFTNAKLAVRKEKERKANLAGLQATYEVWDLERLRRLRESGTVYEPLVVDFKDQPTGGLPCVVLGKDKASFQTCVTVFPGELLYKLYDEYGSRLLELNVRSYLQARGKVNTGILKTLRESPPDFMAFNNGITVVAEEIGLGTLKDGRRGIVHLKGLQIVNGGQTTASIHRAGKEFRADLTHVFVQAKVTVVDPERFQEVVPLISRFSNTQNRVTEADLSANHPYHIGLERISRREWAPDQQSMWFYERARGSYQTAKARQGNTPAAKRQFEKRYPPSQRFSKEDHAKFENTWNGEPHIVSRGGQKNFVHFMHHLPACNSDWEPSQDEYHRYVAKAILFREAQRIVRADASITAYQINVVAYTVSLLAEKTARRIDLDNIWRTQRVSDAVRETLAAWAPVVFEHLPDIANQQGKHIGESFKQQACWDHIRSLNLDLPEVLNDELIAVAAEQDGNRRGKREASLSNDDQNNIARCMELTEKQWLAIAEWGQTSGELAEWQRGICRTLAGYAAERWSKIPSHKQAKHVAGMIGKAKSAGII